MSTKETLRQQLDQLVLDTWQALHRLSMVDEGACMLDADLDLWETVCRHPAVQSRLSAAVKNKPAEAKAKRETMRPVSDDKVCKHCGGAIAISNPTGTCDHAYWPEMLTNEAKQANGFRLVERQVREWVQDTKAKP